MWNLSIAAPLDVPVLGAPVELDGFAGFMVRPMTGYAPGVHVDLPEAAMTADLEPYRVTPATPYHEIAGADTARLKFPEVDTAQACARAAGLWIEDPA